METSHTKQSSVHKVLAHSYLVYFLFLLISIWLDYIFGFKIFSDSVMVPVGFIFLVIASVVIISAQRTGHTFRQIKEKKAEHFNRGLYKYTRIPTQWGLFLLILGFGIINNALFVIIFSILSFVISKSIFIAKQEKMLEEKYGALYTEYKKLVRF